MVSNKQCKLHNTEICSESHSEEDIEWPQVADEVISSKNCHL